MNNLHGLIFAYRSNKDLRELTQHRNTCSIPFGGRYRLVDFTLSSMVNAGVTDVGMIVHSSYQSLLDHVGSGKDWDLSRKHGGLRILPPFGYADAPTGDYYGRMDSLAGVRSYLEDIKQDYVILSGGDVAANLPVQDIYNQHLATKADITAVVTCQSIGEPRSCTYLSTNPDGRVTDVFVHPKSPMGCEAVEVYILSKPLLLSLVDHCSAHNIHSFSNGVILAMKDRLHIHTYQFDGYVGRFHTLDAYFQHSMDLLDPAVRASLFDPRFPIKTKDQSNPSTYYGPEAHASNSLIADGCRVEGEVDHCILFRGVHVEKGARLSHCILMQGTTVGAGATLQYAITDKNVLINPGRMLMGHESYPIAIAKYSKV